MNANQRFLSKRAGGSWIRLDPSAKHLVECYSLEGFPDDEIHLREQVLWRRLDNLVRALIINTNPTEKLPTGEEYQPFCEESRSISLALHQLIKASRLNTLDVTLSMQDRFDGVLKGDKVGLQDFTSLPLFVDDAERLLRDLYGESDNEAINRVRDAVSWIVEEFTKYLRKDLLARAPECGGHRLHVWNRRARGTWHKHKRFPRRTTSRPRS